MITQKKLLRNELMKEIISIRVDTLWKMLGQKKSGHFPNTIEEGATGKFDNKGAIFIPGGLIYQDVDEVPITYKAHGAVSAGAFRKKYARPCSMIMPRCFIRMASPPVSTLTVVFSPKPPDVFTRSRKPHTVEKPKLDRTPT